MKTLIGLGITLAVLAGLAFGIIGYYNSVQTEGVRLEQGLNAQYNSNRADLGGYVSGLYEQIGVANLKSAKMDQIISDAVKGRYDGNMKPGNTGSMFSAITEAYPNIDLSVYDRIVDYIKAKRDSYAADQAKMQTMLQAYDTWRLSGFPHSMIVGWIGFPSQNLLAFDGKTELHGAAAEDQMRRVIVPSSVNNAYNTGVQDPLPIPQN
ncbi:MAG TPA: hypothetical protein V6C72_03125 [Chroococcales cyanobacterium]